MITFNNFTFQIEATYLWGIFGIFLLIFVVIAAILHFHWSKYLVEDSNSFPIKIIFWVVSLILILAVLVSLLVFELGI